MPHPLAGEKVDLCAAEDIPSLIAQYYVSRPEFSHASQLVSFGTSGHRGSSLNQSFNESHILAITQALCDYRRQVGIKGPMYVGKDTHALSTPAFMSALEVLVANEVSVRIEEGFTPTPVISHAILTHNRLTQTALADGVVITPSHNPPCDGGFKYNTPNGGPADTDVTGWIQKKANGYLHNQLHGVKRVAYERAMKSSFVKVEDFISRYVDDLDRVIDMKAISDSKLKLGVDPMGGAGIKYWEAIGERYGIDLEIVNPCVDPTFSFMHYDHDGKVRMDCSSPYAMRGLLDMMDRFDLAFGNDPDFDRHGIVTKTGGLMNPNHYLSTAIDYLFRLRCNWRDSMAIGKTLVSSSMIDRVGANLSKKVIEVPVGFKWFVAGMHQGTLGFGGEESAGASFLDKQGLPWSTDKDGMIMNLLSAEMMARQGKDPYQRYMELEAKHGKAYYARIDAPANDEARVKLKNMNAMDIAAYQLAEEKINHVYTHATGNGEAIGGVKVVTDNGWFAARPSGTEPIYKIYAESFISSEHLAQIQQEARSMVDKVMGL